MELELTTINLNCYDMVLDTALLDEETLESIVPDAYPDIMRILDTEAIVCLSEKKAAEGRAEVSGTVRADILYLPEADGCVQRMTVSLPFSCSADLPAITASSHITALVTLRSADTRSLNPRKILTRVCVSVQLQVFTPRASNVSSDVCCGDEQGDIQQQCETQSAYMVMAVEEKPFTFSDELALPGSRARIQTLLKTRVDFACNESKIIGSKLIFKGEATLYLLYLDTAGSISSAEFELPFSQIMEVVGVGEDADAALQITMTDCTCLPGGHGEDEGRMVSVSLSMLAQAVVREERQLQLLTDVYSTAYAVTAESRVYTFAHLADRGSRRVMMREILETAQPVREVYDVSIRTGQVSQTKTDGSAEVSAEAMVSILYLSEDGLLYTETRTLTASCTLELPDDCVLSCQGTCPGERFASPAASGIEVRFPILFTYLALIPRRAAGVSRVTRDENAPRNAAGRPSIILRMVTEQEKLWDIAKSYGTTAADIMRANALTEEAIPTGQLLLIPKKR